MVKLVVPSWLENRLNDPNVVTIDPRPVVKYLAGHIPNAVNLPVAKILDPKTLGLMPSDQLSRTFGEIGVDTSCTPVLYDSYDGQNAAMLAWTLEYLGHPNVALLSRRLESWVEDDREILYKPVNPKAKSFDPNLNNKIRVLPDEVLRSRDAKILDLRSREEFQGKVATEVRTGHIPGAVNLPWTDLIGNEQGFLRENRELDSIFERMGLGRDRKVVTYCSYGPRAAIGYTALQHLGYRNAAVYDGSFHEWAQRPELPVEGEGLQLEL